MVNIVETQRNLWNRALMKMDLIDPSPENEIINFLQSANLLKGMKGIDIGCGLGRHTIEALNKGFEMTAVDFSSTSIRHTKSLIKSFSYNCNLITASMQDLPFPANYFDFSFSWCVLNHGTKNVFVDAINESIRILKKGGLSLGYILSSKDPRYKNGIFVEDNCYVLNEGIEKGIIHYFPKKSLLLSLLAKKCRIKSFEEKIYSEVGTEKYHPDINHTNHFCYIVEKI